MEDSMTAPYEPVYRNFNQQILAYSPSTAMILDELCQHGGAEIAFHAAYVMVWLEQCLQDKTDAAMGGFTILPSLKPRSRMLTLRPYSPTRWNVIIWTRAPASTPTIKAESCATHLPARVLEHKV
jgi:hypothetical protein